MSSPTDPSAHGDSSAAGATWAPGGSSAAGSSSTGSSATGSSAAGDPSASDEPRSATALPPRADPRKAFRGPASACLSLEVIILPFSLFVQAKVEGGLTVAGVVWVVVLTVGMVAAIAVFSRPWGLPFALALQVATILGWIVSPSLGVLGVIFTLVWALMLWMRHEVIRRQASWPDPDVG